MGRKRRSDQKEGYVYEEYAKASSIVERLKRIAEQMVDPQLEAKLTTLAKKAKNQRTQAEHRLRNFDTLDALVSNSDLDEETRNGYRDQRDTLAGEILVRIYHIHMVNDRAKRIMGA